jgi:hypothetical protein
MKKLIIILLIVFIAASSEIYAQTDQINGYYKDGILLSQNFYGSTSRTAAMGSAFSALGGDLGSISINPAGMGIYRSSEFSFSPGMNAISTNSEYNGKETNDMLYKFGIGNAGLLLNFKTGNYGWKNVSFAIGYNKLSSFNRSYSINGNNYSPAQSRYSSQTDEFLTFANGTYPEQLDPYWERLAFDSYVIDTVNNTYISPYTAQSLNQRHIYTLNGSSGEVYFGLGANLDDKLYFGGSINIFSAYYEDSYDHTETDINGNTYLRYYTFNHNITTSATGANLKVGIIYKPVNELRLSVAFHSPTAMKVKQESDSYMNSLTSDGYRYNNSPTDTEGYRIPAAEFDYRFSSPMRLIAGAALVGRMGILSFDYEYVDYAQMRFSDGVSNDISTANIQRKSVLTKTNNFRVGGELKFGDVYLRGGYAFYGSPFSSSEANKDLNTNVYSTGFGFRNNNFSIDFSYSLASSKEKYYMYSTAVPANLKTYAGNFMTTLGFRF